MASTRRMCNPREKRCLPRSRGIPTRSAISAARPHVPPVNVNELSVVSRLYTVPSYLISDLEIRVSFLPM